MLLAKNVSYGFMRMVRDLYTLGGRLDLRKIKLQASTAAAQITLFTAATTLSAVKPKYLNNSGPGADSP